MQLCDTIIFCAYQFACAFVFTIEIYYWNLFVMAKRVNY